MQLCSVFVTGNTPAHHGEKTAGWRQIEWSEREAGRGIPH